jgi:PAS domain-containing protein
MTNVGVITEPFRELLESLPDGVVVVSAGGEIVAVNTQACALSGYLPDQLVGARIEMLSRRRIVPNMWRCGPRTSPTAVRCDPCRNASTSCSHAPTTHPFRWISR